LTQERHNAEDRIFLTRQEAIGTDHVAQQVVDGDPLLDRQLGLCDREIAFEIDSGAAEEV
jgi:hypothetical protein